VRNIASGAAPCAFPRRRRRLCAAECGVLVCSHTERWKWKYDAATKQGRWILDESRPVADSNPVAPAPRPRITMAELEEDQRKAAEKRAAALRRDTAKRLKRKQMLAARQEQEEEDRRQQVLDQRRAEIEDKRQLMNAGARVRTEDVYFDDMEPIATTYVGEGVMRRQRPAQEEKPGWNSGVGPGSGPPRIGFQPASLIPPPALPPSRTQRNRMMSGAGSRQPTGSSAACSARRRPDIPLCPPSARDPAAPATVEHANAAPGMRMQRQQKKEHGAQLDLDDVLARADQGIKHARLFSAAAASDACSRPETSGSSAHSAADGNADGKCIPFIESYSKFGMQSGRTSPSSAAPSSIHYWNNMAPCSEGGGVPSVGGTPRSAAGGGAYRRKVDALKEQIESLKRVSTAGSVASNASRTSTATASSSRTAYTHTSKTSGRGHISSRFQAPPGGSRPGGFAGREDGEWDCASAKGIPLAKPPRSGAASLRYGASAVSGRQDKDAQGTQPGTGGHTSQTDPPQQAFGSPRLQHATTEGPSRVRGGLAAARAHAALLDSLDLDSPAHRTNAKAEACRHLGEDNVDDMQLRQSLSVVESLDLDQDVGGGHLKGLIRADQWLKRAVDTALGANAYQPRRCPSAGKPRGAQQLCCEQGVPGGAPGGKQAPTGGTGANKLAKRDMSGDGVEFGPATVGTRQISRVPLGRPPASSQSVLRKSAELLKKQSNDTRQLLQQYRQNSGGQGVGNPQGAVREGRQQPPSGASTGAHASSRAGESALQLRQQQSMHAIEEHIHEVDDEEALLMASLARLDCKLAEAADPAAAYLQAAEYKETQQKRHDLQAQRVREARSAPVAIRKLPPAPALDHWNRTEDLQQSRQQQARDQAAFGCGEDAWNSSSAHWGTCQRRPGALQKVERVTPAMGVAAKDRRALLKNK